MLTKKQQLCADWYQAVRAARLTVLGKKKLDEWSFYFEWACQLSDAFHGRKVRPI